MGSRVPPAWSGLARSCAADRPIRLTGAPPFQSIAVCGARATSSVAVAVGTMCRRRRSCPRRAVVVEGQRTRRGSPPPRCGSRGVGVPLLVGRATSCRRGCRRRRSRSRVLGRRAGRQATARPRRATRRAGGFGIGRTSRRVRGGQAGCRYGKEAAGGQGPERRHETCVTARKAALAARLAAGDRRALARAITLVESTRADHRAAARGAARRLGTPPGRRCGSG